MTNPRKHSNYLEVSSGIYLYAALLLLVLPLQWIFAFFLAATVHELGHIFAIKLLGIPIEKISVGITGAIIETGNMSTVQELICSLSGPLTGMLICSLAKYFPAVALCAFIQTLYNLIPVYPFDGGRALRCILSILLRGKYVRMVENAVVLLLGFLTLAGTVIICKGNVGLFWTVVVLVVVGKFIPKKNSLQRCPGQCTIEPLQK